MPELIMWKKALTHWMKITERIRDIWLLVLALIGLIAAAIAIPQLIIAYREKGQKQMQSQIEQLRQKIEALENAS